MWTASGITELIIQSCKLTSYTEMPIYSLQDILTYLLAYLLTYSMVQSPSWEANWFEVVKKFPPFHGTRKFIIALTSVRHLSLSWASPIQSIYPHPTSWRSIIILSTHLRLGLPSGFFPSGFSTKTLHTPSPHPYAPHAQPISLFSILSPAQYWVRSANHSAPRYLQGILTVWKQNEEVNCQNA